MSDIFAHVADKPSKRYPWHRAKGVRRWIHDSARVRLVDTACDRTLILPETGRTTTEEPKELRCKDCWK